MKPNLDWCPVEFTIGIVGGKWKPRILLELRLGPRRFNDLRRALPAITQRILTMQLRALEADGIIDRRDYCENPPRVEYRFTVIGETLGPALEAMENWGEARRLVK